jgi:hypothetical protein
MLRCVHASYSSSSLVLALEPAELFDYEYDDEDEDENTSP